MEFYYKCMETGSMKNDGLCRSIPIRYKGSLNIFKPTEHEKEILLSLWEDKTYWASGLRSNDLNIYFAFTPLRQTITLLIAAMHDEL